MKYQSSLTDNQWNSILQIIDDKRKRKYSLREIFDAMFYLLKSGCHWRMLPFDFPNWKLVYYYFNKWKTLGIIQLIHDILRDDIRQKSGRELEPSLGIIDSQSVKTIRKCKELTGYDGGKKIKGCKRHIVVDTMGLLIAIDIHPANEHDSVAAKRVIEYASQNSSRLRKIIADGGYRGNELKNHVEKRFALEIEVVLRNEIHKFKVIPQRWIVERTFSWLDGARRLTKDVERLVCTSEAMVYLAMIKLMLNREP